MIAVKRIDANTTEATYKRAGKIIQTSRIVVISLSTAGMKRSEKKCVSMIRQTLRLGAKTVNDVAGLKCQRCPLPDKTTETERVTLWGIGLTPGPSSG